MLYIAFSRSRKQRKAYDKSKTEYKKTVKQHEHLKRRLDHEQEAALRHIELRNKTLEMYEQVRQQSKDDD